MKFNKFIWNLYKQSERGQKALERFENIDEDFIDKERRIIEYEFDDEDKVLFQADRFFMDISNLVRNSISELEFKSREDANNYYTGRLVKDGIPFSMADKNGRIEEITTFPYSIEYWYDYVFAVSLGLYQGQPE